LSIFAALEKNLCMKALKEFDIHFGGLKLGNHEYNFVLSKPFFDAFDYQEYENYNLEVQLLLEKESRVFNFHFTVQGTVEVPCDVSNELFDLPISAEAILVVRFGDHFDDEDGELVILPNGERNYNVSKFLFDTVVLSIPAKKVHPDLGKANDTNTESPEEPENLIDPRWNKLKNLLN
jgi:uncharacterized metal-binding protein YceD (DUF177 family)